MTYRHILVATALSLLTVPVAAGNADPVVVVNGTPVENILSQITFEGDNVVLHFADGVADRSEDMGTVTITMPNTTGIARIKTAAAVAAVGNELVMDGIAAGERIAIYDTGGRLRMQTTSPGSRVRFSLESLATGMYIVRAGSNIIKFQKQ